MLPELSGKLPLRTCRGVIAHMRLPANSNKGEFKADSPSILSEAWLAIQSPRDVLIGSTWEWNSRNYSSKVSDEESSIALENVLLPKASAVYPAIRKWEFVRASAGLRAMPPLTVHGSLPLLGSVNGALGSEDGSGCRYWVIAGLGSRGLLYHGLVGKLMAQAVVSSDESIIPSELVSWKDENMWFSKHITTV